MQLLYCLILIFACMPHASSQIKKENIRSIASGTSFGMCLGYCQKAVNITEQPLQVIASKSSNRDEKNYPPVQATYDFNQREWDQLIALLNLQAFRSLGETIGCPDCADGGAEWIQIDGTDGSKRVTFEYGAEVKKIQAFLNNLRKIRDEYLARLG